MDTPTATICAILRGEAATPWRGWGAGDWLHLAGATRGHGVAGLLQRALAARGLLLELPAEARAALREHAYAETGHNLRIYTALAAILAAVPAEVPLVVLKGAALGAYLYPSPGLRPLSDIDFLAPAGEVGRLAAALGGIGFLPVPHIAPELAREIGPHLTLVGGPARAVPVELHWALLCGSADWRSAPVEWFWQRTEPWQPPRPFLDAGGQSAGALRLTPTATLLHQCAHLVLQHGQDPVRLIWVYDLHLLAGRPEIDWADLVAQARRLGWGGAIHAALCQARRCFGTSLDPAVLAALSAPLDRRARFRGVDTPAPHEYGTWESLGELRLPTRLRLLARIVVPSRAWLRAQYQPRWGRWWPLGYPYRWLKPLGRLTARLARRKAPTHTSPL